MGVVKGYMKYEAEILQEITKQRTQILNSNLSNQASEDNNIRETLKTIFSNVENYPNLKANENFLKLQQRLTQIETNISHRREFYNQTVTNYNIWISSFPALFFKKIFNFKKHELFKIKE